MTAPRLIAPLFAAALLSACVTTTPGPARPGAATGPGQRPAANAHTQRPVAGAEAVMGRDQPALVRLFGQPRLNVREGAGQKLQFTNDRCVLDTYLYARTAGATPVVTHVDARAPDGSDVDRAACIAALQRR